MGRKVKIPKTEQMAIGKEDLAPTIAEAKLMAAKLRALAPVGTPPSFDLAYITLTAVGNAECAVDKEFEGSCSRSPDRPDLCKRQTAPFRRCGYLPGLRHARGSGAVDIQEVPYPE